MSVEVELNGEAIKFASAIPSKLDKMDLIFDCEANHLLEKVSKIWVIVAQDIRTREMYVFTDQFTFGLPKHGSLQDGVDFLVSCRSIIAHNVSGYDWWLLNKFFPKVFNRKTVPWSKTHDTLCQSRAQWNDRPARKGVKGNHGLAYYGDMFGYPKPPIEDWAYWDEDKLHRCIIDVEINRKAFIYLNEEKKERQEVGIDFRQQVNIAKYTQYRLTQQELNGLKGDIEKMKKHVKNLDEMIEELRLRVEPLLPKQTKVNATKATWEEVRDKWPQFFRIVPKTEYEKSKRNGEIVDVPIKETYFPVLDWERPKPVHNEKPFKWRKKPDKTGKYNYTKNLCTWFDLPFDDPEACGFLVQGDFCKVDLDHHYHEYKPLVAEWFDIPIIIKKTDLIGGPYTRVYFEDAKLTQHEVVKDYLLELGWIPTEYNTKKDVYGKYLKNPDGSFVQGSPKLTEDSFESIPEGIGQDIARYNTLNHRRRTFFNDKDDEKGWLNQIRPDGRISAGAMAFATSTGRHAQKGIVNVPSPQAVFGEPMREVWIADKNHSLVSTDMDSAQLMILAGYMQDPVFLKAVKEGIEFEELDDEPNNYCEITEDGKYRVYHGTDAHTINSIYFLLNEESDITKARETQDLDLIKEITKGRKKAKNGIYCLLFGGGDKKFAITVGLSTATQGKRIKEAYFKRLPVLKAVVDLLEAQFDQYRVGSGGYIEVGGKTWLWCESKHKVLNYLLMGTEAQIQSYAIIWMNQEFERLGVKAKQVLSIHDEITCECHNSDIEQTKNIMSDMYYQASTLMKLSEPVIGEATAGQSYLAVH